MLQVPHTTLTYRVLYGEPANNPFGYETFRATNASLSVEELLCNMVAVFCGVRGGGWESSCGTGSQYQEGWS
jgi:hypothetical protein